MKNRAPVLDRATSPEGGLAEKNAPDRWQGMTITYKGRLEQEDYRTQFNHTAYPLARHLTRHCKVFEFVPEFTDQGRIHYHGIYKAVNKQKGLELYQLLRKHGFIKIETNLRDIVKWKEYIYKEKETTQKLIGRKEITINTVFTEAMAQRDMQRVQDMENMLNKMKTDLLDGV